MSLINESDSILVIGFEFEPQYEEITFLNGSFIARFAFIWVVMWAIDIEREVKKVMYHLHFILRNIV